MIKYENQCVDCGLHCLGNSCPHRRVPIYICEMCGKEVDGFENEDDEICLSCVEKCEEEYNEHQDEIEKNCDWSFLEEENV